MFDNECPKCGVVPHELRPNEENDKISQIAKCTGCGMETPQELRKVYFELTGGGFHDGQEGASGTHSLQASMADFIYLATHGGEVGKRFWWGGGAQGHKYEVAEREFHNGELLIRAKYVGVA